MQRPGLPHPHQQITFIWLEPRKNPPPPPPPPTRQSDLQRRPQTCCGGITISGSPTTSLSPHTLPACLLGGWGYRSGHRLRAKEFAGIKAALCDQPAAGPLALGMSRLFLCPWFIQLCLCLQPLQQEDKIDEYKLMKGGAEKKTTGHVAHADIAGNAKLLSVLYVTKRKQAGRTNCWV